MNRTTLTALLVVVALISMVIPAPAPAQTMSTISKGTPLNAAGTPITGLMPLSTPVLTFGAASVATRIPVLPAGTVRVSCIASGAVNYGSSAVVADTVSTAHYLKLTDGQVFTFDVYPGTSQPDVWFVPTATGATTVGVRFIAHVQK